MVRVDSPGGSVLASERIRQALLDAKAKKIPVVVSMGSVAASGGYWVSTPGDFIYAEPSTITGSIGVFGIIPSFQGTLQKLGIGADGVKTTPLSGEPDLLKGPSPEADQLIQSGVNSIYGRFLGIVAASRHKTPQQINQIAQGRVWDGGTAHQLGLVDGFGGIDEAVAKAAELAGLGTERGVRYLEPPKSFRQELIEALAGEQSDTSAAPQDAFASVARRPQQQLAAMLEGGEVDPRRAEHPGALPRLPAGRAGAARQARPQPARAHHGMAVLVRLARPATPARSRRSTGPTSRTAGSASRRRRRTRRRCSRGWNSRCIRGWWPKRKAACSVTPSSSPYHRRPAYRWTSRPASIWQPRREAAAWDANCSRSFSIGLCDRDT